MYFLISTLKCDLELRLNGLIYSCIKEMNKMLPKQYVEIITSCISDKFFRIKQEDESSALKEISTGVSQGSILESILYLLYTCDPPTPTTQGTTTATFADDTALLTTELDQEKS